MSLTIDMLQTWRHPRQVFRRRLGNAPREDRALAILIGACFLFYVARWPALARQAHLAEGQPDAPGLQALMGITLFALVFAAPVLFYALAGGLHLGARTLGGRGTAYATRMALFWALLAAAPLVLFQGLLAGLVGAGAGLTAVGIIVALAFAALLGILLNEAHWR